MTVWVVTSESLNETKIEGVYATEAAARAALIAPEGYRWYPSLVWRSLQGLPEATDWFVTPHDVAGAPAGA